MRGKQSEREGGRKRKRAEEKESSSRDLLSNQLPGRATGLAASTSVSPLASWTPYCFIPCLDPQPAVRGRPATRAASLSSPTLSRTLASRSTCTPHVGPRVGKAFLAKGRASLLSISKERDPHTVLKDKGEVRDDHQDEAPRGRCGFPPAGVHCFLRGTCQMGR